MKGTPKKNIAYDPTEAIESANRLTDATSRQERPENEPVKFINLRIKETDYKTIGKLAIDAGITKAAFCKASALYIADMVKQGAFTIGGGGIIDRRG
jgi:hypothetical protein